MGKDELTEGIVTRLFFRTVDIPVNRESKMSSFRAFKSAIERIESGGTMIVFPEGGIADDYPPVLHSFKNGPFRLAIEAGIPIIPVTSLNTWKVLWIQEQNMAASLAYAIYLYINPLKLRI